MNNNKQTAVEWLEKEFVKLEATIGVYSKMYEIIEQAKEMEKQQIIDAFMGYETYSSENLELAEQYYEETFGGNNEQQ